MEDELTGLPIVDFVPRQFPPEPLRSTAAWLVNRAVLRVDEADDAGRRADPLSLVLANVPRLFGYDFGP